MTEASQLRVRRRLWGPAVAGVGVVLAIVLSLAALPRLERFFITDVLERNQSALRLAAQGLNGALNRFEALPLLIAERPILAELLAAPDNAALRDRVNAMFLEDTRYLEASDVYLMDRSGLTIAASSYQKPLSFVGRQFAYRPYFRQALSGELGRYFALGTTSGERGYFYAAPVSDGEDPLGVVALKFTVEQFEAAWQGGESDLVVSDLDGVIFMSNREAWHFRTWTPLSEEARATIAQNRRYPLEAIRPLPHRFETRWNDAQVVSIAGERTPFLFSRNIIPEAGWQVSVLTPIAPALTQARITLAAILLTIFALSMIAFAVFQRRLRLLDRINVQRAQRDLLERRVSERTADLNDANSQLLLEVKDRRAAEARLKATQQELVQAGKLAALGQMSAALSHEFNQPLAAIRAYADNAARFLDRNRLSEVGDNLSRISSMVDRMADISKHLKNFARRPNEQIGTVSLMSAVNDALALMDVRLRKQNVTVDLDSAAEEFAVVGGQVRLQQIIVNLISNALDAMEDLTEPRIVMSIRNEHGHALLSVRDFGHGLSEDELDKAFDPFFTTKDPGHGLGLGLSISYNIVRDFGGRIEVANHPEGGAVFTVALQLADASESDPP